MAMWMDRSTGTFTQMGGEGVPWVGQAPFTDEKHVFVNLGDGTYFHSGLLAVRQAIAAKVNITYKILFNDAVAMTGGQPVDGTLSVGAMTRELQAEGASRIVVVSDDPDKYDITSNLASGVQVYHRDVLDQVQKELRDTVGCSVLIYEQTCATEKRRRRKRGTMPKLAKRVVINELVCEGCGDCAVQSNCLSVEPVDTEFGRKRRINQSTCNQDMSCVKGFCPSLVTIEGGQLKAPQARQDAPDLSKLPPLPEPELPQPHGAYGIVVAGIGGTGVITIGQLLGMAAHLEGKGVITQESAGLAQKGGATWSHIQIANEQGTINTTKVGMAEADLIMGCDPIVAAHGATLSVMQAGRTRIALNTHHTPTAALMHDPDWHFPSGHCDHVLADAVGAEHIQRLDTVALAERLLGDAIYANPMMLGFVWQMGWVPLSLASLTRAIALNAVQVERNLAAFEWGRRAAHDPVMVARWSMPASPIQWLHQGRTLPGKDLHAVVSQRVDYLVGYQSEAYAQRYRRLVERVRDAESALGSQRLSLAVARNLFKLMAYKDEYEVARLLSAPEFKAQIAQQFEGDWQMVFHLAPPVLGGSSVDADGQVTRPRKRAFSQGWGVVLRAMAWGRKLRGTWLDPMAYSPDRRDDRAVLQQYTDMIECMLPRLHEGNLELACQIAELADNIKGYGPVRHAHVKAVRGQWAALMAQGFAAS
jgi:indolepyruvate ferredoxin oxidoreductase